jgi:predicted nicotinamide N-methyase
LLALVEGFFDKFPQFYATSETSSSPWRLNLRHEAIITQHRSLFAGARVLDIASHDGRWSLAALEAGAASVVGIEARPELVDHAEVNLRIAGVDPSRYEFVRGDVFEVLARGEIRVDVVLCLGFLYHTLRYGELLTRIRDTGARHLVIDTEIHRNPNRIIRLADEHIDRQGNAVADEYTYGTTVVTGRPSLSALRFLCGAHGFTMAGLSDWAGLLRDNPEADRVHDYRRGRRITARFERDSVAP